jgi:excinuclease ABC subunit C
MTAADFQQLAHTIPHQPGIYKYYDAKSVLIYVGKAKNLRKRVGSYFSKTFTTYKTHELVQRIAKIEFTIVDSENDAFLLENSLIKEYQPRYNINLKDDKSYPYIVVKKEAFPRVYFTYTKVNDGSEYLGPFTSSNKVSELLTFIKQYIPLRNCKLPLTQSNIQKGKFKVCLEYHLGNCKAPCVGFQDQTDYDLGLKQIRNLLKGNLAPVISHFNKEMQEAAANMAFEEADVLKKKIEHLNNYQEKSVIVSKHLTNLDVFSICREAQWGYVNYLMVQNGTIVQTHTVPLETKLEETDEEVLAFAIMNLRTLFNSLSNEIIVPFTIEYPDTTIVITIPKLGDKKKLLELSEKNVLYFKDAIHRKQVLHLEGKSDIEKKQVLYQLQDFLQLSEVPTHIECFDNSNFQGSYPVSAMVCFKEGIPSKKDYRHYNVKTVQGINDFATMTEVVYRRYKRVLDESLPIPQLIIIDGGKGQLSAAMESIQLLGLHGKTTVVGLAKNEEEIFFPGDQQSIKMPWESDSLKLVRRIRDEVHRFGIGFHRDQRSKGSIKNELESISGIGPSTATLLLKTFRSVKNVRNQTEANLADLIGQKKATIVYRHFHEAATIGEKA